MVVETGWLFFMKGDNSIALFHRKTKSRHLEECSLACNIGVKRSNRGGASRDCSKHRCQAFTHPFTPSLIVRAWSIHTNSKLGEFEHTRTPSQ